MSVNGEGMQSSFSAVLPCETCAHALDPIGGFNRAKCFLCEVYSDLSNPKPTGVLFDNEPCEAYERDETSQQVADAFMMGLEEDGGPGSGNWGHKGRPGKRGGSGKGGGKVMRTGTAATGYSSIKKNPAFNGVKEAAKAYTPQAFWNLLQQDPAADKALREQHASCGTKESYSDYQNRIYDMLHKATQEELAYKEKEARRIKEQAEEAERNRIKPVTVPKDAVLTYKRRPDQFKNEINDVVNQFGLDGKPKLMERADFQQYMKDHPNEPLFFRSYRASDNNELNKFDSQLNGESGEWYIDCSHGGAQYGQGMYAVGVYDRQKDYWPGVQNEMRHYSGLGWSQVAHTRAMMLDPSAKIFTPNQRANAYYGERQIREELLAELKTRPEMIQNSKAYEKSDQFLKSPEFQAINDKEKARLDGQFQVYLDFIDDNAKQFGMTSKETLAQFKMGSLDSQVKKLQSMSQSDRDKMFNGFLNEVNEMRVKQVAASNAGNTAPLQYKNVNGTWQQVPSWETKQRQETYTRKEDMVSIKEIAKKYGKTKQMADLLTKLYYNKDGPYNAAYRRRTELDFGSIVNENAKSVQSYSQMNAGALAALMGYDAINAHGHGQTGSYTVILNRTKLILSKDPVNLHGYWRG